MLNLLKPNKLNPGDKVATVSLSWGGAGDDAFLWRYYQGKERLQKQYGLEVVEMPNTLLGSEFLYNHPEKRAEDFMQAFSDKTIKGIISCIGGEESIRMLPYIDYNIIRGNPKVFTGYSDTTVAHFMCMKAGISSFYGASLMNDFAENVAVPEYTDYWIRKVLFSSETIGIVPCSNTYTSEYLEWSEDNKNKARKFRGNNGGYEVLQGEGTVSGRLIGGCLETMDMLRGTPLFPDKDSFDNAILFLETSEEHPTVFAVSNFFRSLGAMSVLRRIKGIVFGKPEGSVLYEEYKTAIRKVLAEFGQENLPVIYNLSIGHNEPKFIVPFGAMAEINCDEKKFAVTEAAVR